MKGSTIFVLICIAAALVWYRDLRPQKPSLQQVMYELRLESDKANLRRLEGLRLLKKLNEDMDRLGIKNPK